MDKLSELSEQFMKFPGVGPRQARRMTLYLLRARREWVSAFAENISTLREHIFECADCHRQFARERSQNKRCPICADQGRGHALMIVEKDLDVETVERSGMYHGTYFILGGLYMPLSKNPFGNMRLPTLLSLIKDKMKSGLSEIIIALSASPDGDETATILEEKLKEVVRQECLITRLGRGLSTGSELEYADPETIKHALNGRGKVNPSASS